VKERSFSFFLENFMRNHNLNAASVAKKLKLSSPTSVLRILNNKATLNNIKSFSEKLKGAIQLTEEEVLLLERAIMYEQLPDSVVQSRKLLTSLFMKQPPLFEKKIRCTLKNSQTVTDIAYLWDEVREFFNSNPDDEIELYIETVDDTVFTAALYNIISEHPGRNINIHHFFDDSDDVETVSRQLYAILKLSCFGGYTPYIINNGIYPSRRFYAKNITKDIATLIYIYDEEHYTSVEMSLSSNPMCRHIEGEFSLLSEMCVSVKEKFAAAMDDLPAYLEKCRKLDPIVSYELKKTPCFMMIPFDIQEQLYEQVNYMGYGPDHPVIRRLYKILQLREKFMDEGSVDKYYVLSKSGIEAFVATGKTSDYLPFLRALTPNECKRVLMRNISLPNTKVFVLKEDYDVTNVECALFESTAITVFDPSLGYWDNFSEIAVHNKKMLRVIRDFINEELIPNCCYTQEESRNIILGLLESI